MPLILVTVVNISGGGASDQAFSPGIKRAVNTSLFNALPPESFDPADADTAAIIHVPVNTGAASGTVQKWKLSSTLNQLITAINAVESTGGGGPAALGDALTAIDDLTPAADRMIIFTGTDTAQLVTTNDGMVSALGLTGGADKLITFNDADNATTITMGAKGKAILLCATNAALNTASVETTDRKGVASGYVSIDSSSRIVQPNSNGSIVSVLSSASDTSTRIRTFRDAAGEVAVSVRGTSTLVAGEFTLNAATLGGAAVAAQIASTSQVRLNGISSLNSTPALGLEYKVTIVAGTSITVAVYDAAGAAVTTDVSIRNWEVSF